MNKKFLGLQKFFKIHQDQNQELKHIQDESIWNLYTNFLYEKIKDKSTFWEYYIKKENISKYLNIINRNKRTDRFNRITRSYILSKKIQDYDYTPINRKL